MIKKILLTPLVFLLTSTGFTQPTNINNINVIELINSSDSSSAPNDTIVLLSFDISNYFNTKKITINAGSSYELSDGFEKSYYIVQKNGSYFLKDMSGNYSAQIKNNTVCLSFYPNNKPIMNFKFWSCHEEYLDGSISNQIDYVRE